MYLFGVSHKKEHLEHQISFIERICSIDERVLMLELAPNYEELVRQRILKPNFFMALAERYRPRCARVICGDQELTIPENPDWLLALVLGEYYFYPDNRRDDIMIETAAKESPDIIIVGNGHSDDIKRHFPQAYYTVFERNRGYTSSWSHHGRPHIWYRPDRIVTL